MKLEHMSRPFSNILKLGGLSNGEDDFIFKQWHVISVDKRNAKVVYIDDFMIDKRR